MELTQFSGMRPIPQHRVVVIVAGLPGVGKSTLCSRLASEIRDTELILGSDIRAALGLLNVWSDNQRDTLSVVIADKISASASNMVIVDHNFFRAKDREVIYASCAESRRHCILVHISCPVEQSVLAIKDRFYVGDSGNRKSPQESVKWVADRFEAPRLDGEGGLSGVIWVSRESASIHASWKPKDFAPSMMLVANIIGALFEINVVQLKQVLNCIASEDASLDASTKISFAVAATNSFEKFDVEKLTIQFPGRSESWFVVNKRPASSVVVIDACRRILLIQEWKCGFRDFAWGLPGGEVNEGEDQWEAGFRELREECGILCHSRKNIYHENLAGSTYSGSAYISIGEDIEYVTWTPETANLVIGWFDRTQFLRLLRLGKITESAAYALMRMMIERHIFADGDNTSSL